MRNNIYMTIVMEKRFMVSFGVPVSKSNSERNSITQIKSWLDSRLQDTIVKFGNYQIVVNELQCNEPDCVPIETLIVIIRLNLDSSDESYVQYLFFYCQSRLRCFLIAK